MPVDREGPVHKAILAYLRAALPGAVIHHSPNETKWRSTRAMHTVQKAKAMGTLSGFPDLLVIYCGSVWCIEVKAPKGRLSDAQRAVGADIEAMGGRWGVARSVDDARALVEAWKDAETPAKQGDSA
ncbi:VRR-NUC domain-containing protein [Limimaricola cinnabarinus]|uniref:VRR-NUC domain-containing protein n=1 Tax=Limimaricola cinnabarinus TaxID=1125964 RepID=UPI00249283AD|nr:VRR-NUC domain-containing protein [Limimaricola cinnabarinus]